MSPEQITSKQVDARADVFALACVIYEATLGVRAFQGGDALTTMYAILEQPVRAPSEVDPAYPKRLEAVLLRALEKQPDARYQTAAELQTALSTCLDEDLTAPGDRHIARALASALDGQLEARHQTLCAAAERVRRGESLEPPSSTPPHSLRSTTQEGVALSSGGSVPRKNHNRAWLGIALAGFACIGIGWLVRQKPVHTTAHAAAIAGVATVTPTEVAAVAVPDASVVTSSTLEESASGRAETVAADAPRDVQNRYRKARPTATSTKSQPVTASTAAVIQPTSKRSGPAKPPRIIDQSNPFSE
jgi:hypothetical protein